MIFSLQFPHVFGTFPEEWARLIEKKSKRLQSIFLNF